MEADYLKLTNGRDVRVEWNTNSLGAFTIETGIEMTDLAQGKVDVFLLRKIAWYMAKEGERCEGRVFELSEVDLGMLMRQPQFIAFVQIFKQQSGTTEQKKSEPQNKMKKIFFRKG